MVQNSVTDYRKLGYHRLSNLYTHRAISPISRLLKITLRRKMSTFRLQSVTINPKLSTEPSQPFCSVQINSQHVGFESS